MRGARGRQNVPPAVELEQQLPGPADALPQGPQRQAELEVRVPHGESGGEVGRSGPEPGRELGVGCPLSGLLLLLGIVYKLEQSQPNQGYRGPECRHVDDEISRAHVDYRHADGTEPYRRGNES